MDNSTMRVRPRVAKDGHSAKFTLTVDDETIAVEQRDVGNEHVLVYTPHLTVDFEREEKCRWLLLVHLPWNARGEAGLLDHPVEGEPPFPSAVAAVAYYRSVQRRRRKTGVDGRTRHLPRKHSNTTGNHDASNATPPKDHVRDALDDTERQDALGGTAKDADGGRHLPHCNTPRH